jgi:hypothetical protein
MHIICAKEKLAHCQKAMKSLYNKKRSGKEATKKLSEGRLMKWVLHVGTSDDIMPTRERRERYMGAKYTQRCYLSRNVVTVIQGVSDLDLPQKIQINEEKVTLKQSIVCVKSITDLETLLFIGVDMKWNGYIVAASDSSLAQEARMFIAHLPLYLEHALRNMIWKWFLPEHQIFMEEHFVYDNKDGVNRVVDKIKKKQQKQQIQNDADGDATMQSNDSTSTIDSNDYAGGFAAESGAAREAYETAASCQPYEYLDDQEDNIEFNLLLQITLDIPVDAGGIIGDDNNSTGTFASGVSAVTAVTVDKTTNVNYTDESSVISDLTGNLSLRGSDKKKEEQTLSKTTTTGEDPGNRRQDTNNE